MTHKRLSELLGQPKLRNTAQRQAIYEYMLDTENHPSAKCVYQALKPQHPSLSLATVYNTLELLVEAGLVTSLGNITDNKTLHDANLNPHVHLYCTHCKSFMDLDNHLLNEIKEDVSTQSGYEIINSRHIYYGVCPKCKQTSAQSEEIN